MKKTIIAILLLAAPPAVAQPAPAGQCSLIDNGVATAGRPTMMRDGQPAENVPKGLSTPLPKDVGNAVADITFRIESDGSVTDVKTLCVVAATDQQAAAIVNTAKAWRFAPLVRNGKSETATAAYRVSASGIIPLSFMPNILKPIGA